MAHYQYLPGCSGKVRHDTQHAAARAARRIGSKHTIYRCHHCQGWHMTSGQRASAAQIERHHQKTFARRKKEIDGRTA